MCDKDSLTGSSHKNHQIVNQLAPSISSSFILLVLKGYSSRQTKLVVNEFKPHTIVNIDYI